MAVAAQRPIAHPAHGASRSPSERVKVMPLRRSDAAQGTRSGSRSWCRRNGSSSSSRFFSCRSARFSARRFSPSFARATVAERLWAGEEFWFFSLGAVLWLIAFFGLPRPIVLYVFGHELTHALWVWLMGGRVSRFQVGREGGHILTDKNNFWIALAPYFFPLYSILVIALYGVLSLFVNVQPYGRLLYALIGVTWAFHFTFTCWMIPKNQTDLSDHGTFFSLVVIYLINLLLLSVMLVIASPRSRLPDSAPIFSPTSAIFRIRL